MPNLPLLSRAASAVFSEESPAPFYRYRLDRSYRLTARPGEEFPVPDNPLYVVMLNPSTADAYFNDPSVYRCEQLAMRNNHDQSNHHESFCVQGDGSEDDAKGRGSGRAVE